MSTPDIIQAPLPGIFMIRPRKFEDSRGYFYESWRHKDYADIGIPTDFLQDNCSYSKHGVLRGLHIQKSQGQILWPVYGHILQITLDVRPQSLTFGKHFAIELSHTDPMQVYMPPGFAGGFQVLSDFACMNYKCTQYYTPKDEGGVLWNDPDLGIKWPISNPVVSDRDGKFPRLKDVNVSSLL